MKNNDVELVHKILDGNQDAFAELVRKYQKPIHALAWRKVGDFHIAEEITQDIFLIVYQKLATLEDPRCFSGWLYRIAARQCNAWLRKKRMQTASLDDTDKKLIEKMTYSRYIAEEKEKASIAAQREVAHKLLARLQESERTVMTLHYFGEMTCEEISRFLGVSSSTVKSRLRRARIRLKRAEPIIREALEGFHIRSNLIDNIMNEIPDIKPDSPTDGKPFIPWTIALSTIVFVMAMLGIGNQLLSHFQQSYNIDAKSEMTVEIIDAPIVLDIASKPNVRIQQTKSITLSQGNGFDLDVVQTEYVSRFLSAQAKYIVLNDKETSQDILSIFRTPTAGYQDYTVVEIDATAFRNGGMLTIDIRVGSAEASGAFVLFAD
ncbi:RNA polymerase sigma factor, partial [Candidatus Poribacteria bacterium]|nr:RNA polymerase sigma factor [Candidatus Poribacteria bacterium]